MSMNADVTTEVQTELLNHTEHPVENFVREEAVGTSTQQDPLMHVHEGIELVHVHKGNMEMLVEEDSFSMNEGDTLFINGGRMHRARELNNKPCNYKVMYIDPARLTRDPEIYNSYIAPVLEDNNLDYLLGQDCKGSAREICKLMDEIETLEREKPLAYELEVIALAHLVIKQIYLRKLDHTAKKTHFVSSDAIIQRHMTAFIYENYAEHISLDDIARAGGVSRSKCSNIFHEQLGSSPVDYLNKYRLEVAAQRLSSTNDTIASIAYDCGFSQPSYFNRQFLRAYGCTPKQYRKEHFVAA